MDNYTISRDRACETLGGIAVDMGDVGFQFPLFQEFSVILRFYQSDMDFPAALRRTKSPE